jgi:NDP-4-keto-2,6-dideoxyhexose 3-C-methyltransferase
MLTIVDQCRLCGSEKLALIFELKDQSLTGVFPETRKTFVTTGNVSLVKCIGNPDCGLVQLRESYDISEMYGDNYGYRTGLNLSMTKHIESKVHRILDKYTPTDGDLIIDIGSNDATALKKYPQDAFELVGVDPTGLKFFEYYPKSIKLIPDFFSSKVLETHLGNKKAKVITSFSMFYDLEDPVAFASDIEQTLDDEGVWVFEQSYLPSMIETNSFDTICHEHLEFYALKQIMLIVRKAGLKVLDVELNNINGGSFSITAAKKGSNHRINERVISNMLEKEVAMGLDDIDIFASFFDRVEIQKHKLIKFLEDAKKAGKEVYGLGASTKGNVLLQYYGINEDLLPAIGDVNEDKFGKFTPGSLIPIISEADVLKRKPDYLVVLPWHFKDFFLSNPKMKGLTLVFPLPELTIIEL